MVIKLRFDSLLIISCLQLMIGTTAYSRNFEKFAAEKNLDKKCILAEELVDRYVVADIDSIRIVSENLLNYSNHLKSKKGINISYYLLGDYFIRKGDVRKGMDLLRQAKSFFVNEEDYDRLTRLYNEMGIAYASLSQHQDAIKWYLQSLKFGELASGENLSKLALVNLAQAYKNLEEFDKANRYAEEYRDWVLGLGNLDKIANSFAVLGMIALDQEDFELAVYYFRQGFDFAEKGSDASGKGNAYTNIGIVHYLQSDLPAAKENFGKALEYRKLLKNVGQVCDAYLNYGGILFEMNELDSALYMYQSGLTIAEECKLFHNQIELLTAIKELLTKAGQSTDENDKKMALAKQNLEVAEKKQAKVDLILNDELSESDRILKAGYGGNGNHWPFYIGSFLIFGLFVFFIFKGKKS